MTPEEANIEFPDGEDPTGVPGGEGDDGPPKRKNKARGSTNPLAKRSNVPLVLTKDHDPADMLSRMFDLAVAANAMLVEEFEFHELYATYIELFRHDPDPKIRMAAGDRLIKLFKDALVARGVVAQVTDVAKVRSPDGTMAERSVITRHVLRSFEEDANARFVESTARPVEGPEGKDASAPAALPPVGGPPPLKGGEVHR